MITAKTNDGFEIELSEDALDDAELLDALGGMQDGNVFDMSRLTCACWARRAGRSCTTTCAPRTAACR